MLMKVSTVPVIKIGREQVKLIHTLIIFLCKLSSFQILG